MTAPLDGASFTAPATIAVQASASDADGAVAAVDFYGDGVWVGLGSPAGGGAYTFAWTGVAAGSHAITAIVTDSDGLTAVAQPVAITVLSALQCATSTEATATKASLKQQIQCHAAKRLFGPGAACTLTPPPACAAAVVAAATALEAGANNPPAAAIVATLAGVKQQNNCQIEIGRATFNYVGDKLIQLAQGKTPAQAEAAAAIAFAGLPAKCAGVVVKQDVGGVVLPSVGAPCAAFAASPGAVVDEPGLSGCLHTALAAMVASIGNYKAPVVTLTAPLPGATFTQPADVALAATATDADGTIASVAFHADGLLLGPGVLAGATWTHTWPAAPAGPHTITAFATDSDGLATTSSPAAITVAVPPSPPPPAPLQCTIASEGTAIKTSLKAALDCNRSKLLFGPTAACNVPPPPACAGTIVADATALADGPNNPPAAAVKNTIVASKKQLDCQSEIHDAVSSYVGDKMVLLTQGQTPAQAEAGAVAAWNGLSGKCTGVKVRQDASGVILPQVGPQCAQYAGAVASTVDPVGLAACLHTTLEGFIRLIGNYKAPTVAITSPAAGQILPASASVDVLAAAADLDGTVTSVDFWVDGQSLGAGTPLGAGMFSRTWTQPSPGTHTLTAVATDDTSLSTTSASVVIDVQGAAPGSCATVAEASSVGQSLTQAVACDTATLAGTPSTCVVAPPPACAGTLVQDAVALAFGPNDPAPLAVSAQAFATQLACQTAIGDGVRDYVSSALTARVQGQSAAQADALAAPSLLPITASCAGVAIATSPGGVVVPAVGPQCAAALGSVVDTASLTGCLQALLSLWVERVGPSPAPLRPNIVVVVTDDQRWDLLDERHAGTATAVTPQIMARVAGEGVNFPDAYATTPLCSPSRASILTGQYAHNHGVHTNASPFGGALVFDDTETLPLWLQAAGYRTGLVGKYMNEYGAMWAQGAAPYMPPGWDEWHAFVGTLYYNYKLVENGSIVPYGTAPADYATDVLREKAKTFISQSAQMGQPFFLYVGMYAPHSPFLPAPRHIGMFAGLPGFRPPSFNELDTSDKPAWMTNFQLLTATQIQQFDDDGRAQIEMMQAVDEAMGGSQASGFTGILDELASQGVLDDTIVIVVSDHGYLWGEHRLGAKLRSYEESIRMALQVRYPRLAPLPRQEATVALNIDLSPTILELAGASPGIPQDGMSLVRVLDGTETTVRPDWMVESWAQPANSDFAQVHDGTWKYSEFPLGTGELYDLSVDPYEMVNVVTAPQHAARVAAMAARLRQLRPAWPLDVP